MSITSFIRRLLDAGFSQEDALTAAEALEAEMAPPERTARQERNARYYQSRRLKASECKTPKTIKTDQDAPSLSLPLSPQTPQTPTHTHPDIITTRARGSLAKPNGFARFWEAYPRKVGKGAAEKAYAKAFSAIDDPDPTVVIIGALERVKATWRDPEFIPHPTTWLNQRRWEDEPETLARIDDHPKFTTPSDKKIIARRDNMERALAGSRILAERRANGGTGY